MFDITAEAMEFDFSVLDAGPTFVTSTSLLGTSDESAPSSEMDLEPTPEDLEMIDAALSPSSPFGSGSGESGSGNFRVFGSSLVSRNSSTPYTDATQVNRATFTLVTSVTNNNYCRPETWTRPVSRFGNTE